MKSKTWFFVGAVVFLAIAAFQLRPPINWIALVVNVLAGGIFLLLGVIPPRGGSPTP